MKNFLLYIFLIIILLILLIFPAYCSDGVILGIKLLLNSLLPAILPFIIFSNLIIRLNMSKQLGHLAYPLTHFLFGVSIEGSYAVIMGFLCGYPIGAKVTNDLLIQGKISKKEAEYLYTFVNHASPAFIQSYIVISLLNRPEFRVPALLFSYLPEIITGIIFRSKQPFINNLSSIDDKKYPLSKVIDDSLSDAIITISKISSYLIIFSIASSLIIHMNFIPILIKTLFISLLEITTGTYYISLLNISSLSKLFLCIIVSMFGGFSTLFQITSVTKKSNFQIKKYLLSKLLSLSIFSLIFCIIKGVIQ